MLNNDPTSQFDFVAAFSAADLVGGLADHATKVVQVGGLPVEAARESVVDEAAWHFRNTLLPLSECFLIERTLIVAQRVKHVNRLTIQQVVFIKQRSFGVEGHQAAQIPLKCDRCRIGV